MKTYRIDILMAVGDVVVIGAVITTVTDNICLIPIIPSNNSIPSFVTRSLSLSLSLWYTSDVRPTPR